jgi:hypothetical protein
MPANPRAVSDPSVAGIAARTSILVSDIFCWAIVAKEIRKNDRKMGIIFK